MRFLQAEFFFQVFLRLALTYSALAPVASRCTPANAFGFQQHHLVAPLSQVNGRGKPGITAADNTHIGTLFTSQRQ